MKKYTNPYSVSDVNAKQGPKSGNQGDVTKRSSFAAAKESFAYIGRQVESLIGLRAGGVDVPKTNRQPRQGGISPDTNKGRGPTRGNQ